MPTMAVIPHDDDLFPDAWANELGVGTPLTFATVEEATNSLIHKLLNMADRGWELDSAASSDGVPIAWVGTRDAMGESFSVWIEVHTTD